MQSKGSMHKALAVESTRMMIRDEPCDRQQTVSCVLHGHGAVLATTIYVWSADLVRPRLY